MKRHGETTCQPEARVGYLIGTLMILVIDNYRAIAVSIKAYNGSPFLDTSVLHRPVESAANIKALAKVLIRYLLVLILS